LTAVSGSRRVSRLKAKNLVSTQARAAIATKALAYVRVSTEEQAANGHGLEEQERAVRAFAESQGYELITVIGDRAVSGVAKPSDRPGFSQVLELAAAGAFTVLLVHKIDRLARDIRHAVTTVSELAELHDVAFRSVAESVIDTSNPMGRTIFAIFAGMAEQERHVITERTKGGRLQKASKGGFAGGAAPYGYERDREGGLQVVEAEAKIVRRIFRERRQHRTLLQVAIGLNADRIPSPTGGKWWPSTVSYIADNAKYSGAIEYLFRNDGADVHILAEGAHEAIV
jgi:site-specific DNA recombinase